MNSLLILVTLKEILDIVPADCFELISGKTSLIVMLHYRQVLDGRQQPPDVLLMQLALLSNKVYGNKPVINFCCFVLENPFCHLYG